jgi:hypothetical protein
LTTDAGSPPGFWTASGTPWTGDAIEWRMRGDELTEGGVGLEDAVLFAKAIQRSSILVHISAGNMYILDPAYAMQNTYLPQARTSGLPNGSRKSWKSPSHWGSFNLDLRRGDRVRRRHDRHVPAVHHGPGLRQ